MVQFVKEGLVKNEPLIAERSLAKSDKVSWEHLAQCRKDVLASPATTGKSIEEVKALYWLMVDESWKYKAKNDR